MSKYTPIIAVGAVLLLTLGAIYIAVWKSQPTQDSTPNAAAPTAVAGPTPATPGQKPAGVTIEGADLEQRDPQGRLEWKVTAAGEFEFDTKQERITGHDVQFEMLQQDKLPVIIVAPVFDADYAARKLTFGQGVKGHLKDGSAHFQVSRLVYDFDTKKLVGSGGAHFVQGQNSASAQEIVLDAAAKKVRMRGGVRFEHRG